ncbi:hypothetical protein DRW42_10040 [Pedobacter miscanthi]|uniref:Uncharacterized protein n=1 Tax=Pedobacter miscanthi TaxID=2259170 RepID=A0A366L236_9SPHI|nr:hypothetical protein DRW42_10040 [Pedobacter miscanthi]
MIQRQAIQLNSAVEIPNSGSARVNDDSMAITDIALANKYGRNFFMIIGFKPGYSKIKPSKGQKINQLSIFLYPDISTKKVRKMSCSYTILLNNVPQACFKKLQYCPEIIHFCLFFIINLIFSQHV